MIMVIITMVMIMIMRSGMSTMIIYYETGICYNLHDNENENEVRRKAIAIIRDGETYPKRFLPEPFEAY